MQTAVPRRKRYPLFTSRSDNSAPVPSKVPLTTLFPLLTSQRIVCPTNSNSGEVSTAFPPVPNTAPFPGARKTTRRPGPRRQQQQKKKRHLISLAQPTHKYTHSHTYRAADSTSHASHKAPGIRQPAVSCSTAVSLSFDVTPRKILTCTSPWLH